MKNQILATHPSEWSTIEVPSSVTSNVLFFPIAHESVTAINIKESKEELVDLCEINNSRIKPLIHFFPQYQISFSEYSKVRTGVYERLIKMLEFLPDNVGIVYFEGFRPLYKQKEYFDNKFKEVLQTIKDKEQAYQETAKYVSPFIDNIPTHCTGAAIDITLFRETSGVEELLNMGKFGTIFGPNNQQHTFAAETGLTERENRLLLLEAASKADFVNYGFEWWHYSYGDKAWAYIKHLDNAIYGLAIADGKDDPISLIKKEDYIRGF
ncbi:MAG: putative peptidase vanX D-ala-D-ala dipeptidase [Candidatus Midichloriaceae bacterium]|jgi:D-alanyl-D-alanine dipeptidase|nr:putative peptidase vanX D-ala-D-ala dipeptidase [Candidatus Midichloriaceae bacterium]